MFIAGDFKFFEGTYETWLTIRESFQVFCNTEFVLRSITKWNGDSKSSFYIILLHTVCF